MSSHSEKKNKLLRALAQIMGNLDGINPSKFNDADKQALARAKKVCAYLLDLINNWDEELIPIFAWDNSINHTHELTNNMSAYDMAGLNNWLDNHIFAPIAPYTVHGKKALTAAAAAAKKYHQAVDEYFGEIDPKNTETKNFMEEIKNYHQEIFNDDGQSPSIKSKVSGFLQQAEDDAKKTSKFVTDARGNSDAVAKDKTDAEKDRKAIAQELNAATQKLTALNTLHSYMFGEEKTAEDGTKVKTKGFKDIAEEQTQEIGERIKAANKLIEDATDALHQSNAVEMSATFSEQVEKFDEKDSKFTYYFIATIVTLAWLALLTITNPSNLQDILSKILVSLPLAWLAIFFLRRRNEFARLKEEYLHKKTVAQSYMSFKKHIQERGEQDNELEKKLMHTALDAVANNPARVLDAKQNTKSETLLGEATDLLKEFKPKP